MPVSYNSEAPQQFSASSSVTVTSPGALQLTTSSTINNLNGSGNVDVGASPSTLTVNLTSPQTFSGIISNTGNLTLTGSNAATDTLTLTNANSFSGTATVSTGSSLILGATGSLTGTPNLTVQSGGIFDASAVTPTTNITIKDLNGGSTAAVNLGANTLVTGTATTTPVFSGIFPEPEPH